MLTNVVMYLTITYCTVSAPVVCVDETQKNMESSLQSCAMQGMVSGKDGIKYKGRNWTIKKWRCSGRPPDVGI